MRPRMILVGVTAVVAVAVGIALVSGGRDDGGASDRPSAFASRTLSAGAVTVKLEPHHVDATGAEIEVTLDTHSEELDMDLVAGARLVVNDTAWPATTWDGDGPSGHHRSGRLRFDPAGVVTGSAELTLAGSSRRSALAGSSRSDPGDQRRHRARPRASPT